VAALEETEPRSGIVREFVALGLVAIAAFGLISLACLDMGRQPNLGGPLGADLASALSFAFGYQSYVLVVLILALARRVWLPGPARASVRAAVGGIVLLFALSAAGGFWRFGEVSAGGAAGEMIAGLLGAYLNVGGGYIVVILALVGGMALMAGRAPTDIASSMAGATGLRRRSAEFTMGDEEPAPATNGALETALAGARSVGDAPLVRRAEKPRAAAREKKAPAPPREKGAYQLPPLSLLDVPPLEHSKIDEAALERSARMLEQKLTDFGVQGQVVEVQPGPVVTMYKLEPGSGIKVSQIVNLADDLSMALRAATVRILAPVPGEAVVGIEVPNRKREKIYLRIAS
jgi:DNA segregation ATPase FtsK/SpoIIIE, S-DNA-T family